MPSMPRKIPIIALTGDTTLTFPGYSGCLITNQGATAAVAITLPAGTAAMAGSYVDVYVTDNQSVTVSVTGGDQLAVDGDATADSIAWSTSSHKIGNGARFVCIGLGVAATTAGWITILSPAATTTTLATQTIAT